VGSLDENGRVLVSRHLANASWNIVGRMQRSISLESSYAFQFVSKQKPPLGRYVDDYYEASRVGASSQVVCC